MVNHLNQTLMTTWGEQLNEQQVWDVYPRPQLVRSSWINLNGKWSYQITNKDDQSPLVQFTEDGLIIVPFPLESPLSGVAKPLHPQQTLWYKTTFELAQSSELLLLHFGAVDWQTEVWINGKRVGEHKGGYCPFSFAIQDVAVVGQNELIVAVQDDTDAGLQERGKQSLNPSGLFYTAISGIWQTVWLEQLPKLSIASLQFDIDLAASSVNISGRLHYPSSVLIKTTIYDHKMHALTTHTVDAQHGHYDIKCHIQHAKLWHPNHPYLYDVLVEVLDEQGRVIDEVTSYFAMREIAILTKDGQPLIALNGQPIYQLGILDQGYWPDGLYTAPSDLSLIDDIVQMKKLGFNMIRKHIKVEQARFYYHCDRLGMLVWQDMINGGATWNVVQDAVLPNLLPNWFHKDNTVSSYKRTGRKSETNRQQFMAELTEMIEALRHFPCIVVWCPFNEGWGQFDAKAVTDYILQLDSTRLIDHASGWFDQGAGHMRSVHTYFRPLTKPKRTYGRVPVLSEFGGYNLKIDAHTQLGHKEVGYKKCSSPKQLQQLYNKLMHQLAKQIDQGLVASVYTQLSDVEGEVNGLLTYDRQVVKLNKQHTLVKHRELIARFNRKWNVVEQRKLNH